MYIVINGGGKIGEYLAAQMIRKGHSVAVIEKREQIAKHLVEVLPNKALVICGDGCDSAYQSDADVSHADIFVATTGNDDDNLVACEIALIVSKVPRAVARVNNPKNERIFRISGIEAVSSTTIISKIIEEEAFAGDFHAASSLHGNDLAIIEIVIPEKGGAVPSSGQKVSNIVLPEGGLIAAVLSEDELEAVDGEKVLFPGDVIIVLAKRSARAALERAFNIL
ncbi:MAG: TrkA family potassium uptake protein [Actinobacteria bacterium]|nr:TrkA family potassium uptake protein [Actinomycetota bacterium]